MGEPRQGEIWWAELPPPVGRRPVLILTGTPAIPRLTNVTVAPLTRTVRGIPAEVELTPDDGLPTPCAASLENLVTIRKRTLDKRIAVLSGVRMHDVFAALRFVFAIPAES